MAKKRQIKKAARTTRNQRRTRESFGEMLKGASRRAHEVSNRRSGRRGRPVMAAIAPGAEGMDLDQPLPAPGFWAMLPRDVFGLLLLPLGWITLWTLLSQFKRAAVDGDFWQTMEFWHFAIGIILMVGWFASGLLERQFLYCYVLGHEVTHAIFVYCSLGWVTGIGVSSAGGYVTTTKTNLLIALSPYFVPFWSVAVTVAYLVLKHYLVLSPEWGRVFYSLLGITWTFHMAWTLWMIPKDQPDLREHGRIFSLVIILFGNLLVLTALFCFTFPGSVWGNFRSFGQDWAGFCGNFCEASWHMLHSLCLRLAGHGG
jgi:hypothetical protein